MSHHKQHHDHDINGLVSESRDSHLSVAGDLDGDGFDWTQRAGDLGNICFEGLKEQLKELSNRVMARFRGNDEV
jgi:hypothetical protein